MVNFKVRNEILASFLRERPTSKTSNIEVAFRNNRCFSRPYQYSQWFDYEKGQHPKLRIQVAFRNNRCSKCPYYLYILKDFENASPRLTPLLHKPCEYQRDNC